MTRVEFLKEKWAEKVNEHAKRHDHGHDPDLDAFERLKEADPTRNKAYLEFALRTYCDGEYLLEDIERVRDTLKIFHKVKGKLEIAERDIGRYIREADIWALLSERGLVDKTESGKEEKRSDRNRAHLEAKILKENDWALVTPKTAFAARWWGMGTRWCTTNVNTYKSYASSGPLRILITPEGQKYQMHLATGSFCNASDQRLTKQQKHDLLNAMPTSFDEPIVSDVEACMFRNYFSTMYFRGVNLDLPPRFSVNKTIVFDQIYDYAMENVISIEQYDGLLLYRTENPMGKWILEQMSQGKTKETMDRSFIESSAVKAVFDSGPESLFLDKDGQVVAAFDIFDRNLSSLLNQLEKCPDRFTIGVLPRVIKFAKHAEKEQAIEFLGALSKSRYMSMLKDESVNTIAKTIVALSTASKSETPTVPDDRLLSVIPQDRITPKIVEFFAKAGLLALVPGEQVREFTVQIAQRNKDFREIVISDPSTSEEIVSRIFGFRNGELLDQLPQKFRKASFAIDLARRIPCGMDNVERLIGFDDFDTEDSLKEEILKTAHLEALAVRPSNISKIRFPVPREAYLRAVQEDCGLLRFVPLPYRDVEMCLASKRHDEHGTAHFPRWVVNEIIRMDGGSHRQVQNYRPSQRYAPHLEKCAPHEGDMPAALPPFQFGPAF